MLSDARQELERVSAIARGKEKVLPLGILADEEVGVGRVGAPTHASIEELLVLEPGQIRRNGLANGHLGLVRIRVGRVLGMRPRHRDALGRSRAERLVHLEVREAGELVADLDDTVPVRGSAVFSFRVPREIGHAMYALVWLKEEADITVVHDRDSLVLGRLFFR